MRAKIHVKYLSGNSFETEVDDSEWSKIRLFLYMAKEILIKPLPPASVADPIASLEENTKNYLDETII